MEKTKKTILIINNKNLSTSQMEDIANSFSNDDEDCILSGYGIEIWEKDLITGEMKLLRNDPDNVECEEGGPQEYGIETEEIKKVDEEPKKLKVKRKEHKRHKYNEEHFDFLRKNINEMNNPDLLEKFNEKFDMNISMSGLSNQMSREGIVRKLRAQHSEHKEINKYDVGIVHYEDNGKYLCRSHGKNNPKVNKLTTIEKDITCDNCRRKLDKEISEDEEKKDKSKPKFSPNQESTDKRSKTKRKGMSEKAVKIIEDYFMEKTDEELRELIADETGAYIAVNKINDYRMDNGMDRPDGWEAEGFDMSEESADEVS